MYKGFNILILEIGNVIDKMKNRAYKNLRMNSSTSLTDKPKILKTILPQ